MAKMKIAVSVDMLESIPHGVESDYPLSEDKWEDSDTESLAELEGDELENNLQSLRGDLES
jgi:hypothetical protein